MASRIPLSIFITNSHFLNSKLLFFFLKKCLLNVLRWPWLIKLKVSGVSFYFKLIITRRSQGPKDQEVALGPSFLQGYSGLDDLLRPSSPLILDEICSSCSLDITPVPKPRLKQSGPPLSTPCLPGLHLLPSASQAASEPLSLWPPSFFLLKKSFLKKTIQITIITKVLH